MKKIITLTTLILLTTAAVTSAQENKFGLRGWGPRVGLTVNPDQVHFGVHADLGYLASQLRFQPNFELGLGDNQTVGAFNFEANYRFAKKWDVWTPYLGGGIGILFIDRDTKGLGDGTDSEFGASVLGGIEKGISGGNRFFLETKLGLVDAPDVKVTVGWTFGH